MTLLGKLIARVVALNPSNAGQLAREHELGIAEDVVGDIARPVMPASMASLTQR